MLDRRRFAALAAAALIAPTLLPIGASAEAGYAEPFDQAAFEAALAAGGPVLVEISAPWCPTCRAQQAILTELLAQPEFAAVRVFEVDFDSRKDVVRAFGARSQSTLIAFAGGQEALRTVGDASREGIAAMLDMIV